MCNQQGNVFLALAQRWNMDRHYIQPVKQVFPKFPTAHCNLQVFVGCCQDTHINLNHLCSSYPLQLLFLQDTQEFRLSMRMHVSDFIQKNSSFICHFEEPLFGLCCPCERPFFISKQFAFNEVPRNGGTV